MSQQSQGLREQDVQAEPLAQFKRWLADAAALPLAEAAALATADGDGRPSVRMVLVKSWDEKGFVFYTNSESRKGGELAVNPQAALLFHWLTLGRQVRIEGSVAPVKAVESDQYFASRPRGSQLSAAASAQSRAVAGREATGWSPAASSSGSTARIAFTIGFVIKERVAAGA